MNIRDRELERLEAYAKSLGIKVSYRKLKKEYTNVAEFYIDGSGIVVYTWPGLSKTRLLLNLLHEVLMPYIGFMKVKLLILTF